MDLDQIKQILELMRDNDLAEFELEQDGVKVRLRKQGSQMAPVVAPAPQAGVSAPAAPAVVEPAPVAQAAEGDDVELAIIKSPIVGTFYRSAEPGARPFVEVGQPVKQGQVMCIIEAMKLMNEINADCDGEVTKVYVENGRAVQYGERLFAIRPA